MHKMRTGCIFLFAVVIGVCSGSRLSAADVCATSTNLVANCGFETGSFSSWTISGTDSVAADNGIYYGIENFSQYSGNYAAYFGAVGGEITLSQTLNGLIPSDVYTITLEAFNDTAPIPPALYTNNLGFTFGTTTGQVASQVAAGNYVLYTFVAAAPSTSTTLSINSRNDAGFWNIDSITAIQTGTPEPSGLALAGVGIALLAIYFGFRNKTLLRSVGLTN